MAFDSHRAKVVLFGGDNGAGSQYGDTWEWDGSNWSQVSNSGPSPRSGCGMAYDSLRDEIVLFGGSGNQVFLSGDTWTWDGTTWTQVATIGPQPRRMPAMAFDAQTQQTVLFGGDIGGGPTSDTWAWGGSSWSPLTTAQFSDPASPCMVYDTLRGHLVLVTRGQVSDFVGGSWASRPLAGPSARAMPAMAYDSAHARSVFFGGYAGACICAPTLGDMWLLNGAGWQSMPGPMPPPRYGHAMAFDSTRGSLLVFGGALAVANPQFGCCAGSTTILGDAWIQTLTAATASTFGQGCPGPTGIPHLAAAAGSLPMVGATFTMQLTGLPVSIFAAPFGAVGFSNQSFGGAPLPALLDVIGAPGCTLHVSIDQEFALANQSGIATWSISIPFDLNLLGLDAYMQGAVLVPGFNAANLVVSNAQHVVVGSL